MITFFCSTCAKEYRVATDKAGKRAKCAECGEPLLVPTPQQSGPTPSPAQTGVVPATDRPVISPSPTKRAQVPVLTLAILACVVALGLGLIILKTVDWYRNGIAKAAGVKHSAASNLTPEQNAARLAPTKQRLQRLLPPGFFFFDINPNDRDHDLVYAVAYRAEYLGFHHDEVMLAVVLDGERVQIKVYDKVSEDYLGEFDTAAPAAQVIKRGKTTEGQWAWVMLHADKILTATRDAAR